MKNHNSSRVLALLTAVVLSASVLLHPAPARADKAKNYKYGAIALGVVGGYLLSKGKTVEGAAVLGAGAYTYKKGEDARKADKNDRYDYNYRDRDRYSRNPITPDSRDDTRYRDNRNDSRYDNRNDHRYDNGYRDNNDRNRDNRDNRVRVR